ncbi:MAG: thiolase family protein, partial [Anaerolineales bacterium]
LERYRLPGDTLARAAARPNGPTTAEILASPLLVSPLHELEIVPPADGACALVLAAEEMAGNGGRKPIWIRGMGWTLDEHYLGERDLADPGALREAARRAYKLAGITNPQTQIGVAEISDHFAHQRLLWAEGLGFCPPGRGVETLTAFEGPALNSSGGLLRGVPPFVAGLDRLVEVIGRLRQNPGAGLAQGCWGPAGQGQVVVIVENKKG